MQLAGAALDTKAEKEAGKCAKSNTSPRELAARINPQIDKMDHCGMENTLSQASRTITAFIDLIDLIDRRDCDLEQDGTCYLMNCVASAFDFEKVGLEQQREEQSEIR